MSDPEVNQEKKLSVSERIALFSKLQAEPPSSVRSPSSSSSSPSPFCPSPSPPPPPPWGSAQWKR